MSRARRLVLATLATWFLIVPVKSEAEWRIAGSAELELRVFPQDVAYRDQETSAISPSVALQPEFRFRWAGGRDRVVFRPFIRVDRYDEERSHLDIREANYVRVTPTWDALLGVSRVFWGVTESLHLVDIINQTDTVEDVDFEDKLGQPMINLNVFRESGVYGVFVLLGFRERTFPGERRRGQFRVETDDTPFGRGAGNGYVDYALRWSRVYEDWDLGASYFYGTSREPRLIPVLDRAGQVVLEPRYDRIHQVGVDVQRTRGPWLWKLEAIYRSGHEDDFLAAVGGFEYTSFQVFESTADLGFLVEYQHDARDDSPKAPPIASDNDLFLGLRLAFNDENSTSMLGGVVYDLGNATTVASVEAERRLTTHFNVEFEARLVLRADKADPLYPLRRDDSLALRITYSF